MYRTETLDLQNLNQQEQEAKLKVALASLQSDPFLVMDITGELVDTGMFFNTESESLRNQINVLSKQHNDFSKRIDEMIHEEIQRTSDKWNISAPPITLAGVMKDIAVQQGAPHEQTIKNEIIERYLSMKEKATSDEILAFFSINNKTNSENMTQLFETLHALYYKSGAGVPKEVMDRHFKTLGDYCFEHKLFPQAVNFYGPVKDNQNMEIAKFRVKLDELLKLFPNPQLKLDTIQEHIQAINIPLEALLASHGSSRANCFEIKYLLQQVNKTLDSLKKLRQTQSPNDIEVALENFAFELVDKLVKAAHEDGQPVVYLNVMDTLLPEHRLSYMDRIVDRRYPNQMDQYITEYNKSFVFSHIATLVLTENALVILQKMQSAIEKFGFDPEQDFDSVKTIVEKASESPEEALSRIQLINACLTKMSSKDSDKTARLVDIASDLAARFSAHRGINDQIASLLKQFPPSRPAEPKTSPKLALFSNKNPAATIASHSNSSSSSSSTSSNPGRNEVNQSQLHLNRFISYFEEKGKAAYEKSQSWDTDHDTKKRANIRAERLVKILGKLMNISSGPDDAEMKKQKFLAEFKKFIDTPMDLEIHKADQSKVSKAWRESKKLLMKGTLKAGDETIHEYHKKHLDGEELWEMMQTKPKEIETYIKIFQSFIDWDMKQDFGSFKKSYQQLWELLSKLQAADSGSRPKPTSP